MQQMRLTAELARLCHREVAEPVPDPRYDYWTDADYADTIARLKRERPTGPFWVFAYGSLIWKPGFPVAQQKRAVAKGWQRAFSLKIKSHRGTVEQPGYMMCLDRGGSCEGVIQQVPEDELDTWLLDLLNREIGSDEAMEGARWIESETAEGTAKALTFYAAPELLEVYTAQRPVAEVVQGLARACGHWGSGAEYLFNTVSHLEALGIHDAGLWTLQELVAAEIEGLYGRR